MHILIIEFLGPNGINTLSEESFTPVEENSAAGSDKLVVFNNKSPTSPDKGFLPQKTDINKTSKDSKGVSGKKSGKRAKSDDFAVLNNTVAKECTHCQQVGCTFCLDLIS